MATERVRAYRVAQRPEISPVRCSRSAQVHGGPGTVGPPRLRDVGQGAAGAVPLGDLGVQPAFVMGQRVGGVRAADHDQLGGERAEALDLLHALDSVLGVDRAQRRPGQQPIQGCLGDCLQVLTLTARKIPVEPGQGARRLDGARLAFEKMLTYASHVGLYAGQIGRAGQQQGNFP
jgi:hypothetical protein